ncbi:hypothetical protein NVP1193O_057 [Vibrio phage 1.193.O._10N.286.52.C6]|nr:hypothetical protein NVP1193O_057 [Vibrio phage 1.193.O._10N.286.52.C6]
MAASKKSYKTVKKAAKLIKGTSIGRLTIGEVNWEKGIKDSYGRYVNAFCECGTLVCKDAQLILNKEVPSCGCYNKEAERCKNLYEGAEYLTQTGDLLLITSYKGARDVSIKFPKTGYEKEKVQLSQIKAGTVLDRRLPTVYGVGVNEFMYDVSNSLVYKKWHSMLERCYCPLFKERHPEYRDVTVQKEWLNLENFRLWVDRQGISDLKGYDLDKDLLYFGNRQYGTSTCKLLPKRINIFMTDNRSNRGDYPIGVTEERRKGSLTGKFRAQCQDPFSEGKRLNYIGVFGTVEEAFEAWRCTKEKHAIELLEYYSIKDNEIINALSGRYEKDSVLVETEMGNYYKRTTYEIKGGNT